MLRIFSKEQNSSRANLLPAILFLDKLFILQQIFLHTFPISEFCRIFSHKIQVNIVHCRIGYRRIFKIARSLGIHKLQSFIKIQLLGFVPDTEENLVRLICMNIIALQNFNQENVIGQSLRIFAGYSFGFNLHRRLAKIKRRSQQFIDVFSIPIYSGNFPIIFYANSQCSTIRIGKRNQVNSQTFRINFCTFAVKYGRFHHATNFFQRHFTTHVVSSSTYRIA